MLDDFIIVYNAQTYTEGTVFILEWAVPLLTCRIRRCAKKTILESIAVMSTSWDLGSCHRSHGNLGLLPFIPLSQFLADFCFCVA